MNNPADLNFYKNLLLIMITLIVLAYVLVKIEGTFFFKLSLAALVIGGVFVKLGII